MPREVRLCLATYDARQVRLTRQVRLRLARYAWRRARTIDATLRPHDDARQSTDDRPDDERLPDRAEFEYDAAQRAARGDPEVESRRVRGRCRIGSGWRHVHDPALRRGENRCRSQSEREYAQRGHPCLTAEHGESGQGTRLPRDRDSDDQTRMPVGHGTDQEYAGEPPDPEQREKRAH